MIKFVKMKNGEAINLADIRKIYVSEKGNNDFFSVTLSLKSNDTQLLAGFDNKEEAEAYLDKALIILNNFPIDFVSFDQVEDFELEIDEK